MVATWWGHAPCGKTVGTGVEGWPAARLALLAIEDTAPGFGNKIPEGPGSWHWPPFSRRGGGGGGRHAAAESNAARGFRGGARAEFVVAVFGP